MFLEILNLLNKPPLFYRNHSLKEYFSLNLPNKMNLNNHINNKIREDKE